ncbi:ATP-binding protein [Paraburkholderia caribensis]|uniref:ATP-binding protein n=1 Tax=Paraburkholderia caribensis TaxID=75105 RepID=UPI0031DE94B7
MNVKSLKSLGLHRLDLLAGFLHHELGVNSLQDAPVLLMGFRSVARTPLLRARELELSNLRRVCNGLSTVAALKAAAVRYNDVSKAAGHRRLFRIDERTLSIQPIFDIIAPELSQALAALKEPYVPGDHGMVLAQLDRPMAIHVQFGGESRRYTIRSIPATLPSPAMHIVDGARRRQFSIAWSDLLNEAREMDAVDGQTQNSRPGNWYQRLHAVALHSVGADGRFSVEQSLGLDGLRHLIGLPGAGKTTLLMCLLRYLGRREVKVAIFFPSIEVCRQYLEDLRRYGVHAGLLVGQSRETRLRHAHKLAEALATDDPLKGYGATASSAPLFEGVCALPALTSAPSAAFGIADNFCSKILQRRGSDLAIDENAPTESEHRLCPAWSLCGFTRAARELPESSVWLGHILSADTRVPRHTTTLDERYFELIARSFDVVVFDEADRAQQDLDRGGIAELSLSGHDRSFHRQIQRSTLQPIASGNNAVLHRLEYAQLAIEIAEFEKLNVALTHAILRLTDDLRKAFDGLLMSPLRIIGDWLSPKTAGVQTDDPEHDPQAKAKDALCELWESAAIRAFQLRGARAGNATASADMVARTAVAFGISLERSANLHEGLSRSMSDWLAESSLVELAALTKRIAEQLRDIRRTSNDAETQQLVGLLLPVTFTILSYRRLSPRLNDMVDQGLLEPVQVDELASRSLLMESPDNILGSLSGVRFFSTQSQQDPLGNAIDVQLQYVLFAGTPRLLMYRLHEWIKREDGARDGPAVLLTSATSFLPPSPAHHIPVTPHYVLQRLVPEREDAPPSRYEFRPVPDGQSVDAAAYLRFSGERSETIRMANLEKMALALLEGGPMNSVVTRDCAHFDAREGVPRKAAFVVNSYDQARRLKQFIDQRLPGWRDKVIAVVDDLPDAGPVTGYVTSSRVESLGDDDRWQVLIFPPGALGRGTNVVFTSGPRRRDAAIGTLYFLTRPHPAPNDMSLPVSMAAKATLDFDLRHDDSTSIEEIGGHLLAARRHAYQRIGRLLRRPLYARSLGKLFEPFTANIAVNLLQTIGRAMRNGCPVQCFFIDRAWAEKSARGEKDDETSSMLVQLQKILADGVNSDDRREAALYRALYGTFLEPLSNIRGLVRSSDSADAQNEMAVETWHENPLWAADAPFSGT